MLLAQVPQPSENKLTHQHGNLHHNGGASRVPLGPATPHTRFWLWPPGSPGAPKYPIKPSSGTSQGPWEIHSNDRDVLLFGKGLSSSNAECIFHHSHTTVKRQTLLVCVRGASKKKKKKKQADVKCSSLVHPGTSWGLERP